MSLQLSAAFIGFGEAAMAFTPALAAAGVAISAFDIKTDDPAIKAKKRDDYTRLDVSGCESLSICLPKAEIILSLVTADQALTAAEQASHYIKKGSLYCDMNSVAPDTKRAAARLIEDAGGRYIDIAIMAPVHPKCENVPLLLAGPHAHDAYKKLAQSGFTDIKIAGEEVGKASAIKMIRSVLIKGMEALTAEAIIAADRADVLDAVVKSLGPEWFERADYNFDRMMVHGQRRAAEMDEVIKTLCSFGCDASMSEGTMRWQANIGSLGIAPEEGLRRKIAQIREWEEGRSCR